MEEGVPHELLSQAGSHESIVLAVAILGAMSGVLATTLHILIYLRERERLSVDFSESVEADGKSFVVVRVRNDGPRTVTILDIGLRNSGLAERGSFVERLAERLDRMLRRGFYRHDHPKDGPMYSALEEEYGQSDPEEVHTSPVYLAPGERRLVRVPKRLVRERLQPGQFAWPYVKDVRGRVVYSKYPAAQSQS
jgi:hypothetical protein